MKNSVALLIVFSLLSCENSNDEMPTNEFIVTVAGRGIDCKLPLIDFLKEDSARISILTGANGLRYQVLDLDPPFSQEGLTLSVIVRPTHNEELFPCTNLGTGYPWATILNVEFSN